MVNEKHNILNEDELDKLSLNMNGENVKLEDLGLTFQYSPSSRYGLVVDHFLFQNLNFRLLKLNLNFQTFLEFVYSKVLNKHVAFLLHFKKFFPQTSFFFHLTDF